MDVYGDLRRAVGIDYPITEEQLIKNLANFIRANPHRICRGQPMELAAGVITSPPHPSLSVFEYTEQAVKLSFTVLFCACFSATSVGLTSMGFKTKAESLLQAVHELGYSTIHEFADKAAVEEMVQVLLDISKANSDSNE